jgi:LytS/YehU family sensor histidine kinase
MPRWKRPWDLHLTVLDGDDADLLWTGNEKLFRKETVVALLQRYLQIQQVRFGERLRIRLDIPADLLRAMVPNLLLQPLAESRKHGIARRVLRGTVAV